MQALQEMLKRLVVGAAAQTLAGWEIALAPFVSNCHSSEHHLARAHDTVYFVYSTYSTNCGPIDGMARFQDDIQSTMAGEVLVKLTHSRKCAVIRLLPSFSIARFEWRGCFLLVVHHLHLLICLPVAL